MPDPTATLASIPPHATALERAIHRHGSNASRCKALSGAILVGVMVFATMKPAELQAWQRGGGVAVCGYVHDHDSAGG